MTAFALIDYDAAKAIRPERTAADAGINLDFIGRGLSTTLTALGDTCRDVECRLYGGWVDQQNRTTANAVHVLSSLHVLRGRRNRQLFRPTLVMKGFRHNERLVGTYRSNRRPPCQKMIDTLITVDALHLATYPDSLILLVSNDDDFTPPLIELAMFSDAQVTWCRPREIGTGLNDPCLEKAGVRLLPWDRSL